MLYTPRGNRFFKTQQSNGEYRSIEYTLDADGEAVIVALDGIDTADEPIRAEFAQLLRDDINHHRRNLHTHADFFDILN